MDQIPEKERNNIVIHIDCCIDTSKEVETPDSSNNKVEIIHSITVCSPPTSVGELGKGGNLSLSDNLKNVGQISPNSGKNNKKEKRKSLSAKRPPKPPRPPRGFSLDAADQKLIKEISELAMIKRARIERMKALKKMKAAKALSVSASSSGNFIAMLFTVLFCIVIILQGCPSTRVSPSNSSDIGVPSSLELRGATEGKIVAVHQEQWNLSVALTGVGSPNSSMEFIPGSDVKYEDRKAVD